MTSTPRPYSLRAQGPSGVILAETDRARALDFLARYGAARPSLILAEAEEHGQAEATATDGVTLLWVDCEPIEGSSIEDRAEAIIDAATEEAFILGREYAATLIESSAFRYAPSAPLSGEWTDAPTDRTVYVEAMTEAGASIADRNAIRETMPEAVEAIAEAWLDGFQAAPWGDFEEDYPLSVCVDCLQAAAYAEYDSERDESQPRPLALVPPLSILVVASPDEHPDAEPCFSWRSCDTCGSRLGGDRYAGTLIRR